MLPEDQPSPASRPARPRVWTVFVGFVAVYLGLNVLSLGILGLGIGGEVLQGNVDPSKLNTELLTGLVQELLRRPIVVGALSVTTSLVFAGAAILSAKLARQTPRARLRLRKSTVATLLFAVCALFAASELLDMLVAAKGWLRYSTTLTQLRTVLWQMDGRWLPAALMIFAVLPGLGEELFFRGFAQSRLTQRWGPVWGILFSAILFGIAHSDPVHSPLAFVIGLLLGLVVEWTGSLWPAIAAHVANNALSVLGTLGYVSFNLPWPWKLAALGVLALSGLVLLLPERDDPAGASQALAVDGSSLRS